jgi:geranylgeranyl transferase type-2 subunit beta
MFVIKTLSGPAITLSQIVRQIAVTLDAVDSVDVEAVVKYVQQLQQDDGSFVGDVWGEVDTRFGNP